MRVISQDGTIDIPYESVVIQVFGREIYFMNKNLTGVEQLVSDIDIATYSTEEKAKRAMGELQYAYSCREIYKRDKNVARLIPTDEMKMAIIGGVFKFPADEELE